jgi:hypothetical protein
MTPSELNRQILDAARELTAAQEALSEMAHQSASTDREWRMARARAYATTEGTVAERDAAVERETGELRYGAKLREDLRVAALENVRSRRAILSAFQTVANLSKAELDFARTGPDAA